VSRAFLGIGARREAIKGSLFVSTFDVPHHTHALPFLNAFLTLTGSGSHGLNPKLEAFHESPRRDPCSCCVLVFG
jgi:hypothetical protein